MSNRLSTTMKHMDRNNLSAQLAALEIEQGDSTPAAEFMPPPEDYDLDYDYTADGYEYDTNGLKPFALDYLARMEYRATVRLGQNFQPLFKNLAVASEKNEAATVTTQVASKTGSSKKGRRSSPNKQRKKKAKDHKDAPAVMVRQRSRSFTGLLGKKDEIRQGPEQRANSANSSPREHISGVRFRQHSRQDISYEDPQHPEFIPPRDVFRGPPSEHKCGMIVEAPDWVIDSHFDAAKPEFDEKTGLIFPDQLVLGMDISAETCSHFIGDDEELGPIVVSCNVTDVGVHVAFWSSHGGLELQVDAKELLEASESGKKALKSKLRKIVVRDCGVATETKFSKVSTEKFLSDLKSFRKNCVTTDFKVGVMFCKKGQTNEAEMFGNKNGSSTFEEFLDAIGEKVQLLGFKKFNGGLDTKENLSGEFARFCHIPMPMIRLDFQVIFHVSTYMPFMKNNPQQLKRKRHIGNDVVVIVFQERGSKPFNPTSLKTHFVHAFIVVRLCKKKSGKYFYKVCVTHKQGVLERVPPFLPAPAEFYDKVTLAKWLSLKMINLERASYQAPAFADNLKLARRMELGMMLKLSKSSEKPDPKKKLTGKSRRIASSSRLSKKVKEKVKETRIVGGHQISGPMDAKHLSGLKPSHSEAILDNLHK